MQVDAYTLASMGCRKLLMNIAVSTGADKEQTFQYYVDYIVDNHHTHPNSKDLVDKIRLRGNKSNHEITSCDKKEAQDVFCLVEMVLLFMFEYKELK